MAFSVCDNIGKMLAELNVPAAFEAVPDYILLRPEKNYETVNAFRVAKRLDMKLAAFANP